MHHSKCTSVLTEEKFEVEHTIDKTTNVKKNRRKKLKTREEKLETGDPRLEQFVIVKCCVCPLFHFDFDVNTARIYTNQGNYLVKHKDAQQKLHSVMKPRKEAFKDDHEEETNVTYLINLFKTFQTTFIACHCSLLNPTQPN